MILSPSCSFSTSHPCPRAGGRTAAPYDGINHRHPAIRHVVRDEHSAEYAADTHVRLTGQPGVCDVTVEHRPRAANDQLEAAAAALERANGRASWPAVVTSFPGEGPSTNDHLGSSAAGALAEQADTLVWSGRQGPGPWVLDVRIGPGATPIRSHWRRLREGGRYPPPISA